MRDQCLITILVYAKWNSFFWVGGRGFEGVRATVVPVIAGLPIIEDGSGNFFPIPKVFVYNLSPMLPHSEIWMVCC